MRLAGLLGLTGCLIGGGLSFGSQLPVRVYSTADGLRNNSVNRIVQDSRGFLWFCTSEGVSRFDGYGFVNYGVAEGLSHRRVNDVLESRSGEIWIATGGGLSKLGTGPTVAVVPEERVPPGSRWISRLLEDRSSAAGQPALWCGTSSGLYRFTSSDGRFQRVDLGSVRCRSEHVYSRPLRRSRSCSLDRHGPGPFPVPGRRKAASLYGAAERGQFDPGRPVRGNLGRHLAGSCADRGGPDRPGHRPAQRSGR